jgi:NitT/TauT family transport system permease protein
VSPTARARLGNLIPPIVVGIAFLALWELFVDWRDIKPYLLPKPSAIWDQIGENRSAIWEATKATGLNALVGLVAGVVLGVLLALFASRFKVFSEMVVPVAAAVNAIPIIALAPIFYRLFSVTSDTPRRLVVTVIVFFPVFVNVLKGLTQVDPVHLELMRSYAASDGEVLRKLRMPNALPFLFTSLKLAASLSVIAAVVAEYFGGLQNGLGSRITSAAGNSAFPRAWAYVAAACALGLVFYLVVAVLERILLPWQAKRRTAT